MSSLVRSSSDLANPVPALVTSVRDEGTVFAALAVKNFFQNPINARRISASGYFLHQFLVDFLRLLQVRVLTDGSGQLYCTTVMTGSVQLYCTVLCSCRYRGGMMETMSTSSKIVTSSHR